MLILKCTNIQEKKKKEKGIITNGLLLLPTKSTNSPSPLSSIPYTQTETPVKTSPSSPSAILVGIWPCDEMAIFVSLVEDKVEDVPLFFPVEVDVPVAVGVG